MVFNEDSLFFSFYFDIEKNKIPSKSVVPNAESSSTNASAIDILPYIRFNKNVQEIIYNSHSADCLINIKCTDGSKFTANHLICTISLGVLKECHFQLFKPILPSWKVHTIDGLMFGSVDKIYVEFEKPFWHEPWDGFSMLWKSEQLREIQTDPVVCDWLPHVVGFFQVSGQPNVLCGWIIGPAAQQMENKSDADIRFGVETIFHMFLRDQSIPKIITIFRYRFYFLVFRLFNRR